jgi:hypothetical protein
MTSATSTTDLLFWSQVAPNDAGEYLYFMGGFLTFNIWMLFVSYRGVPKLYLMRSVQVRYSLPCK